MSNRQQRRQGEVRARCGFAFVHPGQVATSFLFSMAYAMIHELVAWGAPFSLIGLECGVGEIEERRNDLVKHFLDETELEWLWFVDTDMGFAPDTLSRLIDAADPVERPVVGALCFGLRKNVRDEALQASTNVTFPTILQWEDNDDQVGFRQMIVYPEDTLLQVGATGAACFVVHRTVLEKIRANYGDVWFDRLVHPKKQTKFSEDISFFVRVAGCDFPTFVHTGIKTSHNKGGVFLREKEFIEQELLRKIDQGKLIVTEAVADA